MNGHRPSPVDKLTIPGRLLLIADIIVFALGFYLTYFFVAENFPSGSYPIAFLCLPIFIVCFFFFLIGAWILERLGIKVYAAKPDETNA